jgi:hypothetical protein
MLKNRNRKPKSKDLIMPNSNRTEELETIKQAKTEKKKKKNFFAI